LATDQTHFYIMVTSLIGNGPPSLTGDSELLSIDECDLIENLVAFGNIIDGKVPMPKSRSLSRTIRRYLDMSAKQTTDVSRRQERQDLFIEAIRLLCRKVQSKIYEGD
jgi:hypothetical protein